MAIGYSVIMENKKLTEKILIGKFEELGLLCNNIENLDKGINIDFNAELGFSVYLIDAGEFPYNSWETIFYETDFAFEKILGFRFDDDYIDLEKRYKIMLTIVFNLMLELKENAIFISNGDTELCLFKQDSKIYINTKTGIWDRSFFRDIIIGKDIEYFI